ncbi:GNAT family N-acetyltransferase [Hasllibacter sp. MH4015]|uniref:GNAT family N-acetyltransferase n=1 Tax=Hasllibacter sp. MH4015 TaxID=2854029 RepID=UPI001CD7757D|nr:GNAT family N-acetyltransferase [Hasllibacter sp. MH4015]
MIPRLVDIPQLETERLILRAPEARDLDALAPFVMSDRASFVGGGSDADRGDAWRVLATLSGHWHLRGYGVYVIVPKGSDTAIGSMGPWNPEGWPEPELSWTIWDAAAEGQGFAFEAMIEIRRYVYDVLGWDTAVSYIDPANTRSIALAERMGCVIDEGANGPGAESLVYRHPVLAEVLA